MSADNAIFIKKWQGSFYVWHDFMSWWMENDEHEPPTTAVKFGDIDTARTHASEMTKDYTVIEYGIVEEI